MSKYVFYFIMFLTHVGCMAQGNGMLCVIGDSYVRNHHCPVSETWHAKAAEALDMDYLNLGINGNCVGYDRTDEGYGKPVISRIGEILDSATVILIIAGHNDAGIIAERKDYSVRQFSDSLDSMLKRLVARFPAAAIGYVTPWNVDRPYFQETISEIIRVCRTNGIPVLDISSGIIEVNDPEFRKRYFQGENDTAHLNDKGHDLMVDTGVRFIRNIKTGKGNKDNVLTNGVPWFDTDGNIINAHGACIVEDGGKYWLFGEYKSDESNAFPGFGCYSSTDLVNWEFERVVLPVQKDGILGPNRIGERVKVMRCPSTGEYVMLMHADNLKYTDPNIGIAVCDRINGDYKLLGTIEYNGNPIKQWDMGTFQDEDGTGYLLIHHGPIYKLSEDYRSIIGKAAHIEGMGESPAMFKKDGIYYLLTSNLTSWERNDNYYFTATSIEGPWVNRGLFCPKGSLTHNSQCTFVFPLQRNGDIIPIYMGDRWSYPHQASAATYVWLPITTDGVSLSIPEYWASWNIEKINKVIPVGKSIIHNWSSNNKGNILVVPFHGNRISIIGKSNNLSGYALVSVKNKEGKILHRQYVDFYSKTEDYAPQYVSRFYPKDDYVLEVEVSGENSIWFDKKGNRFGSSDYYVNISKTIVE